MDTLEGPGADSGPTQPGAGTEAAERRAFYESLLGAAVGGRYQLERLIDFGSMGAVYSSRHKSDEVARHAIKILDPDLSAQRQKLGPPTGEYQLPRD